MHFEHRAVPIVLIAVTIDVIGFGIIMPVLPALYREEFKPFRADPEVLPYEMARGFVYHDEWSASLFRAQGVIVRVMCIDTHDELAEAWQALIAARFPPQATAEFENLDIVNYAAAKGRIKDTLGPNKIKEVRLAKELADQFREKYRKTAELAKRGM